MWPCLKASCVDFCVPIYILCFNFFFFFFFFFCEQNWFSHQRLHLAERSDHQEVQIPTKKMSKFESLPLHINSAWMLTVPKHFDVTLGVLWNRSDSAQTFWNFVDMNVGGGQKCGVNLPCISAWKFLIRQFKHQTRRNLEIWANDWWGCGKFSPFDCISQLGYIGVESGLQITFGA